MAEGGERRGPDLDGDVDLDDQQREEERVSCTHGAPPSGQNLRKPTDQPSVGRRNVTPSIRNQVPARGPDGPMSGNIRNHVPALGVVSTIVAESIFNHVPARGVGRISAIGHVRGMPDGIHSFPFAEATVLRRLRDGESASLPKLPLLGSNTIR